MKSKLIFRIFVNSVPKSGTHLLTRIVSLLGYRSTSSNRYVIQKILTRMRLGHPNVFTFPTVNRNLIKIMYDWYDKIHPHVKVPIGVTLRAQVSHNLMYRWLLSIHPGCFVSGHVPWSQTTDQILKQLGFKHVIIVRDPGTF